MLFCAISTVHSHLSQEQRNAGLARRAEWKYPTGVKVINEVWRPTAPHVISIFETDSYEHIMAIQLAWQDVLDMSICPATTFEQGLATGAKLMGANK